MKVLYTICAIILFFVLYPYLRIFVKRVIMCLKLKSLCHSSGFVLIPAHRLWFLGRNRGAICDFYIETPDSVFSVKLFSVKHRLTELRFIPDGKYYTIRYIPIFNKCSIPIESKKRAIVNYNFREKPKNEWYLKDIKNVLLVNPICYNIYYKEMFSNHEKVICSGDIIYGMTLYSFSGFRRALRYENEKTRADTYL